MLLPIVAVIGAVVAVVVALSLRRSTPVAPATPPSLARKSDWPMPVWLRRGSDRGALVPGVVQRATLADAQAWQAWVGHYAGNERDAFWPWYDAMVEDAADPSIEYYALWAAGELQGLRKLQLCDSRVEAAFLSTAPWNRGATRRYWGAGKVLVAVAVMRSLQTGRDGVVTCTSLPDAETFHEENGMVECGEVDLMKRYRFEPAAARAFLGTVRKAGVFRWEP